MQANQITLSVDVANNDTPVSEAYTRFEEFQNRSVYIGADDLPESRNRFGLYRTFATKSGNFKGVSKSALKFTQDVDIPGVDASTTLTSPIIMDLSISLPVGVDAADVKHLRQRLVAALDDDTLMDSLMIQQMV